MPPGAKTPPTLAGFRLGTNIDWVRVRVALPAPSHHRHIRARTTTAGLVVGFIEHLDAPQDRPASVVELMLHDPGTPGNFMRRVQVLAPPNAGPIRESDIQITGVEIALDTLPQTAMARTGLVDAATHLFRHVAHPPAGGARITGPGNYQAAALQGQVRRALRDGLSINAGCPGEAFAMRAYVKRTDTRTPGETYAALPSDQHCARLEVILSGCRLPFSNIGEWQTFRFESLAQCFAQVLPCVPDSELPALLLDQLAQLGRPLDTDKLNQHRRTSRKGTRRDKALNKRIADALRALTRRTLHDVQSAGIREADQLDKCTSPEGTRPDTAQGAKYLNTATAACARAAARSIPRRRQGRQGSRPSGYHPRCGARPTSGRHIGALAHQTFTPLAGMSSPLKPFTKFFPSFPRKCLYGDAMKTTIHPDIADLLARAHELADTPAPELEFDPAELEIDFSAPAPAPAPAPEPRPLKPAPDRSGSTEKISIRIPRATLAAAKARARTMGIGYQTLINRVLRAAIDVPVAT